MQLPCAEVEASASLQSGCKCLSQTSRSPSSLESRRVSRNGNAITGPAEDRCISEPATDLYVVELPISAGNMEQAGSADLISLGRHCALEECGQVDFLPFKCSACAQTFCLEHRTCKAHRCVQGNAADDSVIVCPICAKGFRMQPGETADTAFDRHSGSGCNPANYKAVHNRKKCPVPRCQEKLNSTNVYKCKHCQIEICLKHRLPADHHCQRQPQKQSLAQQRASSVKQPRDPSSPLSRSTKVITSAFSNLFSSRRRP